MDVEIRNLHRYFGTTKAVCGVSFGFSAGEIFGFVGPNGAGKTTTMRIMATLDEPTHGDALIDGYSVVQNPEWARRRVGFMPDALPAHRDITTHEYLDFFARAYGIKAPRRAEIVDQVEEFTNLLGLRDKRLAELSKGMKQRVSLARAIVHDPAVLILDEPAAGLDPRARIELRELLRALAQQGKAILISSHILSELGEICSGVVFIEQGRLLRAGTIQEIGQSLQLERTVLIRPFGQTPEQLLKTVLELPSVRKARPIGQELAVELLDGEDAAPRLLAELVSRGVMISEFRQKQAQLEDLFMNITKGEVQ